ncbi:MAG: acyltransferase [Bryobacteraceae bacterium]
MIANGEGSASNSASLPRLRSIQVLRGLAAFAVFWHHLTIEAESLVWSGRYGKFGVEVFFVISGFIIPYSLFRASYTLRSIPKFLLKRLVRVDPPYIASIVVAILLPWVSTLIPGFRGTAPPLLPAQWLAHLAYLNVYFHYPWLNDVYWTLAIEFQFYLLIGLLFPVLVARNNIVRVGSLCAVGLLYLYRSPVHLSGYIHYFMVGIALFQYRVGLLSRTIWWLVTISLLMWAAGSEGVAGAIAASMSAAAISSELPPIPFLEWLGALSYTLYLFHYPILRRIVHLGLRLDNSDIWRLGLMVIATAVTVACSRALYLMIEKPSQEMAAKIQY